MRVIAKAALPKGIDTTIDAYLPNDWWGTPYSIPYVKAYQSALSKAK